MEDELSRFEKNCMLNCFHKTFRYLAHANTVFTFFTGDAEMIEEFMRSGDDTLVDTGSVTKPVIDAEGNEVYIPTRKEMEKIATNKQLFEKTEL